MSEQEQILGEISRKMDQVVRLLALNLVKDMKTQKEQILTLSSFDFGPLEISKLLGTTSNTVNVALSQARKKKREKLAEEETTGDANE